MGLRNKDLISIHDLSVGEVATILDVAKKLKRKQKAITMMVISCLIPL